MQENLLFTTTQVCQDQCTSRKGMVRPSFKAIFQKREMSRGWVIFTNHASSLGICLWVSDCTCLGAGNESCPPTPAASHLSVVYIALLGSWPSRSLPKFCAVSITHSWSHASSWVKSPGIPPGQFLSQGPRLTPSNHDPGYHWHEWKHCCTPISPSSFTPKPGRLLPSPHQALSQPQVPGTLKLPGTHNKVLIGVFKLPLTWHRHPSPCSDGDVMRKYQTPFSKDLSQPFQTLLCFTVKLRVD